MGKSYKKLLRDPRWQKKRLKVFERAGWACESCGDDKEELHVHHTFYDGRKPWKYPKKSLVSLCKTCHRAEHEEEEEEEVEWFEDAGDPLDTMGFDGDFFLNTTTKKILRKINGVWDED